MKNGQSLETGFTLVELMVAMVIGLVTLGAALALYLTIFTGSITTIRSARLNHDIDSAINLISNELRRAGYNANASTGGEYDDTDPSTYCSNTNPFGIAISSNCVLYSYDVDEDGILDDAERFGFMLGSSDDLQIRLGGSNQSCDLSNGTWEALSITSGSERVTITSFDLSTEEAQCAKLSETDVETGGCDTLDFTGAGFHEVRRNFIRISLSGSVGDGEIVKESTAHVVVANDQIIEH